MKKKKLDADKKRNQRIKINLSRQGTLAPRVDLDTFVTWNEENSILIASVMTQDALYLFFLNKVTSFPINKIKVTKRVHRKNWYLI